MVTRHNPGAVSRTTPPRDRFGDRLQRLRDDVGDVGHRPHLQRLEHLGRDVVQVGLVALRDENR